MDDRPTPPFAAPRRARALPDAGGGPAGGRLPGGATQTGQAPVGRDASADTGASAAAPRRWDGAAWEAADDAPPEEAAIALVIDGTSQAVLMATPHDLEDFALGFALTEGLIAGSGDVTAIEIAAVPNPVFAALPAAEVRLWLRPGLAAGLAARRRAMVGPVGCGLCGVDSIAAALPDVRPVPAGARFAAADVTAAMAALTAGQGRWRETPGIHAAALWTPGAALVREDVGRHNALDKLAGAAVRGGLNAAGGIVAMTSRLSVDLVQKTARIGAPVLVGAGVPTQLAIAWAEAAGIALIGRARGDGFTIFTGQERVA